MRFIHTADWHLGRLFHGQQLVQDQYHVLEQLVEVARQEQVDAVLVAGDVYDRAVPPPEAVELLDEVLSRLILQRQIPVVLIAGNHDSPHRLSFASRLLEGRKLYVAGAARAQREAIQFNDQFGPIDIYPLPYAEPAVLRQQLSLPDAVDHNAAMHAMMDHLRKRIEGRRCVVVAHAFVAGGRPCESERPLSVGGAGTVDSSCFDGFSYVALGHLHAPQRVNGGRARYSGALLKYSFDEVNQPRSIDVVDVDAGGTCQVKSIALSPKHDVRRIEGTMAQLIAQAPGNGHRDDYIEALVLDDGPVLNPAARLREHYPNVLNIRRPKVEQAGGAPSDQPDVRKLDDSALFAAFFEFATGEKLTDPQAKAFATTVESMRAEGREGLA